MGAWGWNGMVAVEVCGIDGGRSVMEVVVVRGYGVGRGQRCVLRQ
jgi:hypothetical protein